MERNHLIIHLSHGKEDIERASLVFTIGNVTLSRRPPLEPIEVTILLTLKATKLVTEGYIEENLIAKGFDKPLKLLIDDFILNGGNIWVCSASASQNDIKKEDLINGARIVGATSAADILLDSQTLCF